MQLDDEGSVGLRHLLHDYLLRVGVFPQFLLSYFLLAKYLHRHQPFAGKLLYQKDLAKGPIAKELVSNKVLRTDYRVQSNLDIAYAFYVLTKVHRRVLKAARNLLMELLGSQPKGTTVPGS